MKLFKKLLARKKLKQPEPVIIPRSQHSISRAEINPNALKVLYQLKDAGFSAYLVGGGVRDLLLGLHPKDFDVVTNAHPEQIKPLFRSCILIGRRFRLAHVRFGRDIIEVATFRAAISHKENRKHFKQKMLLKNNVYGTLTEDIWRRDFTVNALYYNIADFSIVDYPNGMEDLNNKILRMIGDPVERYHEDPVRLLRVVRLAAKLEFNIAPETEAPIIELAPLLQHVPPARLFDEILKLFHAGKAFPALRLLQNYQLFQQLFPLTAQCVTKNPQVTALLKLTCQTTDDRVNNDKHVSAGFLFASFLWYPVQDKLQSLLAEGILPSPALHQAIRKTLSQQAKIISIPRRFTEIIRDIWELQTVLIRRRRNQVYALLQHPRFRAAYDFLILRATIEADILPIANWWTSFQDGNETERHQLIHELPKQGKSRRRK